MKKLHKIFLSLIILILLTSYNPNKPDLNIEKNNSFLKIKKIKIINNVLIEENEIKKKLEEIFKKNIFSLDKKDIEEPLKKINFFKKVEVKKKYPNTIIVKIFETKPVAVFYKNKAKYLLDSSSNLIVFDNSNNFDKLPIIVGEGAKDHFMYFYNQLKKNNFPIENIQSFYYFQIGRWDLKLLNNKILKFPNENTEDAIKQSVELLNRKDFKNYNIIDLRVNNKIIVE